MRKRYQFAVILGLVATLAFFLWLRFHRRQGPESLALEECDPAGLIACAQQAAFLSVPVADTGLYLTYSSQWANSKDGQRSWDAGALGLGGWSINLLQRYDSKNNVILSGDGSWRIVKPVALRSGEYAIPSYHGSLAYIFDSAGRHVRTVDGHLGTILLEVEYDAAGRVCRLDGYFAGQPVHLSVRRAPDGVPTQLVGTDGATTALRIDASGRLTGVTDPAGETTQIAWDANGLPASQTDPLGGVTRFTYDQSGELASITDADGVRQRFDRSVTWNRLEIQISTPRGRHAVSRTELLKGGIRRSFTAPDGTTNTETTFSDGRRTLALANRTTWKIGAVANPVWGMAAPILSPVVQTRPDGVSARREVKDNLQSQGGLPYAQSGSVVTTINGQAWTQQFDPAQRSITLKDPVGRRTLSSYDEHGHVLSYSVPGAAPVSYAYNLDGREVSKTVGTGKLARTTRYRYDANTGEIVTTRPDGVTERTTVDKAGRTVTASGGDGSTVLLGYDAAGRITQLQPPGGLNFTVGMSPAGRPTAFAPPAVQGDASIEISSYDKDGQLHAISGLGTRSIAYGHDAAGRVTSIAFDQGKRTLTYDPQTGLVTKSLDPSGVTTAYGYTGSAETSLAWSGPVSGSVSLALDANGRAVRENVNGGNEIRFGYDSAGDLVQVGSLVLSRDPASGLVTRSTLGIVETRQEYDESRQLIRTTASAGGRLLLDVRYSRDELGRIKNISETFGGGKNSSTAYSYDRADRLATVRLNGRTSESDTYDPAGNRVRTVVAGKTLKASYDDRDRLVHLGNAQYTWMPDGTLAGVAQNQRASAFLYDDFGALRRVSLPDGRKIQYLVDADGRRVGRRIEGNFVGGYLYGIDGSLAAATDGAGKIISRFAYDDAGHLAFVQRNGAMYRVISDPVGSPLLIIDSRTGAIAEQITYDAWGNVTQDTAPGFIPISFAGGLRDPDTGLIRFGARDYDPATGHWTAADPVRFDGGDANLYQYAGGDPINSFDKTGLVVPGCTPQGVCNFPPPDWYLNGQPPPTGNPGQNGAPGCTPQGVCNFPPPDWYLNGQPPPTGPGGGNGTGPQGGNPPPNGNPTPNNNTPGNNPSPARNPPGFSCVGIFCQGPNGSCWFCSMGEPHATMPSGFHFDFQAVGEFLVARSPDGKYIIQARQQPFLEGAAVTINTALAANVNGDRIGVYINEPSFLLLNNSPLNELEVSKQLPHGGFLERHGGIVLIRWPGDGGILSITRVADSLNYSFQPGSNPALNFTGLLGNANGAPDKIAARDGSLLSYSDPEFVHKLYKQVGNSWRIKQSESLFHYWPGESTVKFTDLNFPPKYISVASLASTERANAESICRAVGVRDKLLLDDCVFDVAITGMPAFAAASVGMSPVVRSRTSLASGSAPAISTAKTHEESDDFAINIGDTVSPDHPAGAGVIKRLGEKQSYSFAIAAPENVYVSGGACEGSVLGFNLLQSDNSIIGGRIGCGDFGPITLPKRGGYRILVTADGPSARYSFTLRAAPEDHYSIRIGDTVSPDHPSQGAGIINSLGQRQLYSFPGRAGEIIFLQLGPCEGANPSFSIVRPDTTLLDSAIANCAVKFRDVLPATGTYQILATTDRSNVFSRYGFSLHSVPADQHFSARLPLTVSPGVPAHDTGHITVPGAQQSFDFTAKPGTFVRIAGNCPSPCSNLMVRATRAGDSSASYFFPLNTSNEWKLPDGGKYAIQVRSNGYVGDYSFAASETMPH